MTSIINSPPHRAGAARFPRSPGAPGPINFEPVYEAPASPGKPRARGVLQSASSPRAAELIQSAICEIELPAPSRARARSTEPPYVITIALYRLRARKAGVCVCCSSRLEVDARRGSTFPGATYPWNLLIFLANYLLVETIVDSCASGWSSRWDVMGIEFNGLVGKSIKLGWRIWYFRVVWYTHVCLLSYVYWSGFASIHIRWLNEPSELYWFPVFLAFNFYRSDSKDSFLLRKETTLFVKSKLLCPSTYTNKFQINKLIPLETTGT